MVQMRVSTACVHRGDENVTVTNVVVAAEAAAATVITAAWSTALIASINSQCHNSRSFMVCHLEHT